MEPANHLRPAAATSTCAEPLPAPGEIHLWRADLDADVADPAGLSPDERDRAARYRTAELAQRFTAARLFLRRTLARYLGRPPESLCFTYTAYGRPGIEDAPFDFNLSHSEGDALLAVARETVGVDIERRRPDADLAGMARQVMSTEELRRFEALPDSPRLTAFYDLWTVKEAAIKALGAGFSRDARTLHLGWDAPLSLTDAGRTYCIQRLDYAADVPASVALDGDIRKVSWRG
jgi:4'-phosphopantetheinyl transferase